MTELSILPCNDDEKIALEDRVLPAAAGNRDVERLIRRNLNALWDIFVETEHKSIAYFSVRADTPKEVNEVFRRLNTGGVALTQLELVLGKIKAVHSDYEEKLWTLAETIERKSGIKFSSTAVLQFFHLLSRTRFASTRTVLKVQISALFRTPCKMTLNPWLRSFRAT